MRIQYTPCYSRATLSASIEDLIAKACDGSDYYSGSVESAARTASNTAEMLGRLIDMLASRGALSADDVIRLAGLGGATDVEMS